MTGGARTVGVFLWLCLVACAGTRGAGEEERDAVGKGAIGQLLADQCLKHTDAKPLDRDTIQVRLAFPAH